MKWIASTIFLIFISLSAQADDADSLKAELERKNRYIEQQRTVLEYYDKALSDCDTTNTMLRRSVENVDSENRKTSIDLKSKNATIKSQHTIIKVLAAVVITLVAGEVVRDLARK